MKQKSIQAFRTMAFRRRLHSPKSSSSAVVAPITDVKGSMSSIVFVLAFCLSWKQNVSNLASAQRIERPSEAPSTSDLPRPVPTLGAVPTRGLPTRRPAIASTTQSPISAPSRINPLRPSLSTTAPSGIPPQPSRPNQTMPRTRAPSTALLTAVPQPSSSPTTEPLPTPFVVARPTAHPALLTISTLLPAVPQPSEAPTTTPPSAVNSTLSPTLVAAPRPTPFLTTTPPTASPVLGNNNGTTPTHRPSDSPSDSPSDRPSDRPSDSPSDTPSSMPTANSTAEDDVPLGSEAPSGLLGEIVVVLYSVPEVMSPNNIEEFENDLSQFFNDNLQNYSNWIATLSTNNKLTSRQRLLRQRRLGETRHLQTNSSSNSTSPPLIELVPLETRSYLTSDNDNIQDIDAFNNLLRETMNRNSTGFTLLLRSAETISNQVYFARIENVEAVVFEREQDDTAITEMPSGDGDTIEPSETLPPSESSDSDGWTAAAMAGTVLGIVVGMMACLTLILWLIKKKSNDRNKMTAAQIVESGSTDTGNVEGCGRAATGSTNVPSSSTAAAIQAAKTSRATKSRNQEVDDETQLDSRSLLSVQDTKADEMSYAYSLDAGGGTSFAGGGGVDDGESTAGSTGLVVTKGSLGTSDLDAASSSGGQGGGVTRQIVASPGKLGLILDTILGKGPVVHKVNSNSPLKGSIFEGDVIIAINGIDTRQMNAEEITEIMVKTARAQRILIIQSEYYR